MNSASAFSQNQYELCYPDGIENHYWNRARSRIVLKKAIAKFSETPCMLEIGCGTGYFVEFANSCGIECYGSEISQVSIKDHLKKVIFPATNAFDLSFEFRQKVNIILLLDVLEHLSDPETFLLECQKAFPNLKRLVMTFPARQELWSNYDEFYGHYKRYDRPSVLSLVSRCRPTKIELGYFFHSLYLPAKLVIWLKGKRNVVISAPKQIFLHRLISYFFVLEEMVLSRALLGSSIWSVADLTP